MWEWGIRLTAKIFRLASCEQAPIGLRLKCEPTFAMQNLFSLGLPANAKRHPMGAFALAEKERKLFERRFAKAKRREGRARPRPVGDKGSARSGSNLGCGKQAPPCEVRALVATVIKSLLLRQIKTQKRIQEIVPILCFYCFLELFYPFKAYKS